jgi:hypothetical protein
MILPLATRSHRCLAGPADREKFGDLDDFVAARVPEKKLSQTELDLYRNYQKVRDLRERKVQGSQLESELQPLIESHKQQFPFDWLLFLESYELLLNRAPAAFLTEETLMLLKKYFHAYPDKKSVIEDGLSLAQQL